MKKLLISIFPPEFFRSPAYAQALALAMVYVGVALAQLFSFEKFPAVVHTFDLPGGQVTTIIMAGLLPLVAAAALPFLLSMQLSPRSRRISGVMVVATPALWLVLGLWQMITVPHITNSGLFGATLITSGGLWLVLFAALWLWAAILCVRHLPPRRQ